MNRARNSQLYVKAILPHDTDGPVAAPGKRIGF